MATTTRTKTTNRSSASRSTTRKPTGATAAKRSRTTAKRQTARAASANATAASKTATAGAKETRNIVERTALVGVGATLIARDTVIELVDRFGTRTSAERELKKFERRGATARTRLEREARRARTRAERLVRRERRAIERDVTRRRNVVTKQVSEASKRLETTVQAGLATGERVVKQAREQVLTLV